jgi:hypothetical protein
MSEKCLNAIGIIEIVPKGHFNIMAKTTYILMRRRY